MKKNVAAPRYRIIFWLPLFLIAFGSLTAIDYAYAGMYNELSDVQNAIFHLSPRDYEFTAETDKADEYIDEDQADFFIAAAEVPKTLEVDGNYPFSVVDTQIRDSDIEMVLDADGVCCPYPKVVYLSRDNIYEKEYNNPLRPPNFFVDDSYKQRYQYKFQKTRAEKEYNDRLNPPGFFTDSHEMNDPFYHERVKTTYFRFHDYEVISNEVIHRSVTDGEDCIRGYMLGGYAISRGCVNVWISETRYPASCKPKEPQKPKYTGRCDCSSEESAKPAPEPVEKETERWHLPVPQKCYPKPQPEFSYTGKCKPCGD